MRPVTKIIPVTDAPVPRYFRIDNNNVINAVIVGGFAAVDNKDIGNAGTVLAGIINAIGANAFVLNVHNTNAGLNTPALVVAAINAIIGQVNGSANAAITGLNQRFILNIELDDTAAIQVNAFGFTALNSLLYFTNRNFIVNLCNVTRAFNILSPAYHIQSLWKDSQYNAAVPAVASDYNAYLQNKYPTGTTIARYAKIGNPNVINTILAGFVVNNVDFANAAAVKTSIGNLIQAAAPPFILNIHNNNAGLNTRALVIAAINTLVALVDANLDANAHIAGLNQRFVINVELDNTAAIRINAFTDAEINSINCFQNSNFVLNLFNTNRNFNILTPSFHLTNLRAGFRYAAPAANVVTGVDNFMEEWYGSTRMALINALGQYCSYCEMPVLDQSLSVEHVLPQSEYPDLTLTFNNFLLGCRSCDGTNKANQPLRAAVMAVAPALLDTNLAENSAIQARALATFLRPHVQANDTFNNFDYQLFRTTVPAQVNFSVAYTLNRIDGNRVYANNIPNGAGATITDLVELRVVPTAGLATNTCNALLGLNRVDYDNPSLTDRRMSNRTKASLMALQAYNSINLIIASIPVDPNAQAEAANVIRRQALMDILWPTIINNAVATGFYSTWLRVFRALSPAPAANAAPTPYQRLRTGLNDQLAFPGTNYALVPVA